MGINRRHAKAVINTYTKLILKLIYSETTYFKDSTLRAD